MIHIANQALIELYKNPISVSLQHASKMGDEAWFVKHV